MCFLRLRWGQDGTVRSRPSRSIFVCRSSDLTCRSGGAWENLDKNQQRSRGELPLPVWATLLTQEDEEHQTSPFTHLKTTFTPFCGDFLSALQVFVTSGRGRRLMIKCARRGWPGRRWAGWPCRSWWCWDPGKEVSALAQSHRTNQSEPASAGGKGHFAQFPPWSRSSPQPPPLQWNHRS